ncbi:hypothetical protein [Halobacillus litoralis]|uniref:hypothetical protein n=1 Tax=Halobacillus litoralis TaxID=45668 RepID=UPI001CFECC41|nr:hypothetical protein [Halobacillus litoralis]
MKKVKRTWIDHWDPLYVPLLSAVPIESWLLVKTPPFTRAEISLYILGILFLFFSGFVETGSEEEKKNKLFGYLYLLGGLLFGTIGLYRWLI